MMHTFTNTNGSPVLDGGAYTAFELTLSQPALTPIFLGFVPGSFYPLTVIQDATGGHEFDWPVNVDDVGYVSLEPNSSTTYILIARLNGSITPLVGGAVNGS